MLRKDVVVQRPEGTKIYRQRNCVYVYHVTGSEYKKDKTVSTLKHNITGTFCAFSRRIIYAHYIKHTWRTNPPSSQTSWHESGTISS